jgi:hypothetical protein
LHALAVAKMDVHLFVTLSNKQSIRRYRNEAAAGLGNTGAWPY